MEAGIAGKWLCIGFCTGPDPTPAPKQSVWLPSALSCANRRKCHSRPKTTGPTAFRLDISASRFVALGTTKALNFAPGTNFGTVDAGIFSAAPVYGFFTLRVAAGFADLKNAEDDQKNGIVLLDGGL